MREESMIVRTLFEGTVSSNANLNKILDAMGCDCFNNRGVLGKVRIVVDKENGQITRSRVVFLDTNDPNFNTIMQANADAVQQECERILNGSTEPDGEIKVVVVSKM